MPCPGAHPEVAQLTAIMKLLDTKFDWFRRRQGTAKKMQKDLDIAAPKDEGGRTPNEGMEEVDGGGG